MTIIMQESIDAREYESSPDLLSIEVTSIVSGAPGDFPAQEATVREFLEENAPTVVDSALINTITAIELINEVQYRVKILYENVPELEEDVELGPDFTFDTTGGTIHIQNALEVIDKVGNPSIEIGTSINVQPNGDVKGVDITSPVFNFTVTKKIPDSQVTGGFVQNIYDQTGTINTEAFSVFGVTFLTRDILFLGAQGQVTEVNAETEDEWTLNYRFAAQKSLVDHQLSPDITVPLKAGWDYLSVQYQKVKDANQSQVVPKVLAAYVMRVYEQSDFTNLGAF